MTNLLLDFGANPNSRREYSVGYETPLLIASEFNYFRICEMLLDYGADPTAKNSTGMNSLHLAAKYGNLEICLLLITRGCDPNIRDDFGNNASFWAKRSNHSELLQYLPPPLFVTPIENKNYKEEARAYKMGIDIEEEKKKAAKKKGKK
jgi:ankyrin repeat protein